MGRRKKNNGQKSIHFNMLVPSREDLIALCLAVQDRFLSLSEMFERTHGYPLIPPASLDSDMLLWRTMAVRHKSGDYRHTDDEKRSLVKVANWTLEEKCKLTGQTYVPFEWHD